MSDLDWELYWAVFHNYVAKVEGLLERDASVNNKSYNGVTPLHEAAKKGFVEIAELLIKNKADGNAPDNVGVTPLHEAAKNGYVEIAELLIKNKADVNAPDNVGDSPLHEAASQGNESVVKTLLSAGANVSARNNKGTTPYELVEKANLKKETDFISAIKYNKTLNYLEEALEQQTLPDKKHEEYSKQSNFPKAGPYKQKIDKDIKLPWLVDADEFQRMLSHGEYLSYENRLSLGGPCRAGKSTLASVLIDEEIPLKWNSTDGLVIFFGRNGIDIENKKMVPLKKENGECVIPLKRLILLQRCAPIPSQDSDGL